MSSAVIWSLLGQSVGWSLRGQWFANYSQQRPKCRFSSRTAESQRTKGMSDYRTG